jgi:hypothetical protein
MGVEPTAAGSAPPATDFEDQGAHRDTCPPGGIVQDCEASGQGNAHSGRTLVRIGACRILAAGDGVLPAARRVALQLVLES